MDNENQTENATEKKSIIDPKYAQAYKDKPKDWLAQFVDAQATDAVVKEKKVQTPELDADGEPVMDADGKPVTVETTEKVESAKRTVNLDSLFALAKANGINTAKYEEQRDRPNAPGRLRMTIGNMLRAAAKKRHGLFDTDGEWVDADKDFLGDAERVQERDGTKIAKAKPAAEAEPAGDAEEEEADAEE